MEVWFHQRLQDHRHDRLRHAVGYGRNAEGARAARCPSVSRRAARAAESTSPTPSGSRPCRGSPSGPSRMPPATRHPRPQRHGSPSPAGRLPRRVASECHKALPQASAPPIAGWPRLVGWSVGSLRSARITRLRRYYEPVRPCASHRYSAPLGSATWRSPFASRRQVPTFRTRASRWSHAVFMPVAARPVGRLPPSFVPGQQLEPGFGDVPTLSTRHQRFTRVRLTSAHLTGLSRLFRNAHHPGLVTDAACGGLDPDPAIRARGADPHLLCSKAARSCSLHHNLLAPSWRTVVRERAYSM